MLLMGAGPPADAGNDTPAPTPTLANLRGRIYRAYNGADSYWMWVGEATWDAIDGGTADDVVEIQTADGTPLATQNGVQTSQTWFGGLDDYDASPIRARVVRNGTPGAWTSLPGPPANFAVTGVGLDGDGDWIEANSDPATPVPGDDSVIASCVATCNDSGDSPSVDLNGAAAAASGFYYVLTPSVDHTLVAYAVDTLGRESFHVEVVVPMAVQNFRGRTYYTTGRWFLLHEWDDVANAEFDIAYYAFGVGWQTLAAGITVPSGFTPGIQTDHDGILTDPWRIRATVDGVPGLWACLPGCPQNFVVPYTTDWYIGLSIDPATPVSDSSSIASATYSCDDSSGSSTTTGDGEDVEFPVGTQTVDHTVQVYCTDSKGRRSIVVERTVLAAVQNPSGGYNGTDTQFGGDPVTGAESYVAVAFGVGTEYPLGAILPGSVPLNLAGLNHQLFAVGVDGSPGLRSQPFTVAYPQLDAGAIQQDSYDSATNNVGVSWAVQPGGGNGTYTVTVYVAGSPYSGQTLPNSYPAGAGDPVYASVNSGDAQTDETDAITVSVPPITIGTLSQSSFDSEAGQWVGSVGLADGAMQPYDYVVYVNGSPMWSVDPSNIVLGGINPGDSIQVEAVSLAASQSIFSNSVTAS